MHDFKYKKTDEITSVFRKYDRLAILKFIIGILLLCLFLQYRCYGLAILFQDWNTFV